MSQPPTTNASVYRYVAHPSPQPSTWDNSGNVWLRHPSLNVPNGALPLPRGTQTAPASVSSWTIPAATQPYTVQERVEQLWASMDNLSCDTDSCCSHEHADLETMYTAYDNLPQTPGSDVSRPSMSELMSTSPAATRSSPVVPDSMTAQIAAQVAARLHSGGGASAHDAASEPASTTASRPNLQRTVLPRNQAGHVLDANSSRPTLQQTVSRGNQAGHVLDANSATLCEERGNAPAGPSDAHQHGALHSGISSATMNASVPTAGTHSDSSSELVFHYLPHSPQSWRSDEGVHLHPLDSSDGDSSMETDKDVHEGRTGAAGTLATQPSEDLTTATEGGEPVDFTPRSDTSTRASIHVNSPLPDWVVIAAKAESMRHLKTELKKISNSLFKDEQSTIQRIITASTQQNHTPRNTRQDDLAESDKPAGSSRDRQVQSNASMRKAQTTVDCGMPHMADDSSQAPLLTRHDSDGMGEQVQQVAGGGQHVHHVGPDGHHVGPDGQHVGAHVHRVGPDGQHVAKEFDQGQRSIVSPFAQYAALQASGTAVSDLCRNGSCVSLEQTSSTGYPESQLESLANRSYDLLSEGSTYFMAESEMPLTIISDAVVGSDLVQLASPNKDVVADAASKVPRSPSLESQIQQNSGTWGIKLLSNQVSKFRDTLSSLPLTMPSSLKLSRPQGIAVNHTSINTTNGNTKGKLLTVPLGEYSQCGMPNSSTDAGSNPRSNVGSKSEACRLRPTPVTQRGNLGPSAAADSAKLLDKPDTGLQESADTGVEYPPPRAVREEHGGRNSTNNQVTPQIDLAPENTPEDNCADRVATITARASLKSATKISSIGKALSIKGDIGNLPARSDIPNRLPATENFHSFRRRLLATTDTADMRPALKPIQNDSGRASARPSGAQNVQKPSAAADWVRWLEEGFSARGDSADVSPCVSPLVSPTKSNEEMKVVNTHDGPADTPPGTPREASRVLPAVKTNEMKLVQQPGAGGDEVQQPPAEAAGKQPRWWDLNDDNQSCVSQASSGWFLKVPSEVTKKVGTEVQLSAANTTSTAKQSSTGVSRASNTNTNPAASRVGTAGNRSTNAAASPVSASGNMNADPAGRAIGGAGNTNLNPAASGVSTAGNPNWNPAARVVSGAGNSSMNPAASGVSGTDNKRVPAVVPSGALHSSKGLSPRRQPTQTLNLAAAKLSALTVPACQPDQGSKRGSTRMANDENCDPGQLRSDSVTSKQGHSTAALSPLRNITNTSLLSRRSESPKQPAQTPHRSAARPQPEQSAKSMSALSTPTPVSGQNRKAATHNQEETVQQGHTHGQQRTQTGTREELRQLVTTAVSEQRSRTVSSLPIPRHPTPQQQDSVVPPVRLPSSQIANRRQSGSIDSFLGLPNGGLSEQFQQIWDTAKLEASHDAILASTAPVEGIPVAYAGPSGAHTVCCLGLLRHCPGSPVLGADMWDAHGPSRSHNSRSAQAAGRQGSEFEANTRQLNQGMNTPNVSPAQSPCVTPRRAGAESAVRNSVEDVPTGCASPLACLYALADKKTGWLSPRRFMKASFGPMQPAVSRTALRPPLHHAASLQAVQRPPSPLSRAQPTPAAPVDLRAYIQRNSHSSTTSHKSNETIKAVHTQYELTSARSTEYMSIQTSAANSPQDKELVYHSAHPSPRPSISNLSTGSAHDAEVAWADAVCTQHNPSTPRSLKQDNPRTNGFVLTPEKENQGSVLLQVKSPRGAPIPMLFRLGHGQGEALSGPKENVHQPAYRAAALRPRSNN